jgi:hypothetical protein
LGDIKNEFYFFEPIAIASLRLSDGLKGGTLLVAQLVEALHYKPESRGFDSRWCHWNFPLA